MPDNVRLYSIAGHSHVGASGVGAIPTATGTCANATNGYRSYAPLMRALLVALDAWVDGGIEPPRSDYPDVRDGTLATVADAAKAFPAIPGCDAPIRIEDKGTRKGCSVDHLPEWNGIEHGRCHVFVDISHDLRVVLVRTESLCHNRVQYSEFGYDRGVII